MNFRISALGYEQFALLFELPTEELAENLAVRCTATTRPGSVA